MAEKKTPHVAGVINVNFDRDDESDVAVLYGISAGNDTVWFMAIFEHSRSGLWYLVNQVYLGGRGLRHLQGIEATDRTILIKAKEFQGDEPLSSPSLDVIIEISWQHDSCM